MSLWLRYLARRLAYCIALLLAAVWTVGALESLMRPLYDLSRPIVGDVIIIIAAKLGLASVSIMVFALMLVGLKFLVGALLLAALFSGTYEKLHFGSTDDALLDVSLLVAAIATALSAMPGLLHGGELLLSVIGELMLCVIASALAIYGRGYVVREEIPAPVRPVRAQPIAIAIKAAA